MVIHNTKVITPTSKSKISLTSLKTIHRIVLFGRVSRGGHTVSFAGDYDVALYRLLFYLKVISPRNDMIVQNGNCHPEQQEQSAKRSGGTFYATA